MINKDQWCNVLEFSRTILPDLSNYDEDGACKSIYEPRREKTNVLVSDLVQYKLGCTATEDG